MGRVWGLPWCHNYARSSGVAMKDAVQAVCCPTHVNTVPCSCHVLQEHTVHVRYTYEYTYWLLGNHRRVGRRCKGTSQNSDCLCSCLMRCC
jgi:hypothetical protein